MSNIVKDYRKLASTSPATLRTYQVIKRVYLTVLVKAKDEDSAIDTAYGIPDPQWTIDPGPDDIGEYDVEWLGDETDESKP